MRDGTTWKQQAYLKASNAETNGAMSQWPNNTDANDQFGISVATSGDSMVIGAGEESSNATGVNGNQSNNSAFECWRGLRLCARWDDLDPASLSQSLQFGGP